MNWTLQSSLYANVDELHINIEQLCCNIYFFYFIFQHRGGPYFCWTLFNVEANMF